MPVPAAQCRLNKSKKRRRGSEFGAEFGDMVWRIRRTPFEEHGYSSLQQAPVKKKGDR
jgi:hypothetical protein